MFIVVLCKVLLLHLPDSLPQPKHNTKEKMTTTHKNVVKPISSLTFLLNLDLILLLLHVKRREKI